MSTPIVPDLIYGTEYSSFSGADMLASITVPMLTNDPVNGVTQISTKPVTIANIQTLSISSLRQKAHVHALGRIKPKGTTRGVRTIAGTLVFMIFDREALAEVQKLVREFYQSVSLNYNRYYGNAAVKDLIPNFRADELPPFDITITGANEYGQYASCRLVGVEIVSNGTVMGVNELYLEDEMQYIAQDYIPIYPNDPGNITKPTGTIV